MPLVVVDTNLVSLLVKLRSGQLRKDEERAHRYEAYLQGQDMIRAFPTEAELLVWLKRLPADELGEKYAQGIREFLDQTGLIDGTDLVAQHWARIVSAGEKMARVHVRDRNNPKREAQLNDTWIAACALAHGLPLVSDNRKDFEWMVEALGLELVSYAGAGQTLTSQ
ncbi:PIN domain-containing protein [Holophaga foetida]|uniref:PIN domain-containing protein n=1 Tax=Holophaga foetida TaxID=35839 RepID=UPI0002474A30|nr:PIN domain-containing protein [Holophaga foetida]